ncbi:hypothetical protein GCM10027034_09790 [Ramlibacter solisilvae]|uniref:Uncharacterized protein n=1 Tax=Ramlibacter tataouinensis TaxID=94132 RepID=A0A140HL66_9BURK|nr:hypothetical protein [Ramlibacter tataouinensis]AMO25599.1 hypothetical protein UC35_19925 [Ramlibacter tataouinensis]
MKIGDLEYRFTRGSDVVRDGMFLEADVVGAAERRTVAEVFYSDATGKFSVTLFEESVPAELVEFLIADAKACLPPTHGDADG